MAVVKFVVSGCPMNNIFSYVMREEATEMKLVDGIMCSTDTALEEFRLVKQLYGKENGRQYYHIVQSFSPEDNLTPETAHEIGMKFVQSFERFRGFQAVVATHVNRDHLHNHIILNSVSCENGYKFHQTRDEMLEAKRFSNDLCREYGLSVTEEKSEYGNMPVWKKYLKGFIELALERSPDKETFTEMMERHGYGVKWEDGHKYITFTTPEGYRCRDNKLFDERFLRCNMETYFAMGGCCSPAADAYLRYRTPVQRSDANMTSTSGLIFMMADIFRGSEKKTIEEIEAEKNARDIGTVIGLIAGTVIAMAERYREDYTENPEKYGIRQRDSYFVPRLVM